MNELDAGYWERKFYSSKEEVHALINEPEGIDGLMVAVCEEDEEAWASNGCWVVPASTFPDLEPQGGWTSGIYTTTGDAVAARTDKLVGHVRKYREATKAELRLRCYGDRPLMVESTNGALLAIFIDYPMINVCLRVDYLRLVLGNEWADTGATWWHTKGDANSPVGIEGADGETLLGLLMPTLLGTRNPKVLG